MSRFLYALASLTAHDELILSRPTWNRLKHLRTTGRFKIMFEPGYVSITLIR